MLIDSEIRLWGTDLDGEIANMKIFRIHFLFNAFCSFLEWNLVTRQYENN